MALEPWGDYPKVNQTIKTTEFFDELKINLIEVIKDYADLGVNDEPQMIAQTEKLFTDKVVPSKKDWITLETLLDTLTQRKEFRDIWNRIYPEAKPTLNIEDLNRIRDFVDAIQLMPPNLDLFSIEVPAPNITLLTKPTVSSTNAYKTSFHIAWGIDQSTLALKIGKFKGNSAPNEDVMSYRFSIEAGPYKHNKEFGKEIQHINHEIPLDWWKWFGQNINQSYMNVHQFAVDKRGNESSRLVNHRYPAGTKMQAPIVSYEVEYQINSGTWFNIARPTQQYFTWTSIPKISGRYTFRVRGKDAINEFTPWVVSDPVYVQYVDYSMSPPIVTGRPAYTTITTTWTHVPKADYYEVWLGAESTAKSTHSGSNTRWKRQPASNTRSIVFNNLKNGTSYKQSVRALNRERQVIGYTTTRTLVPKPPAQKVTKTYNPTGNQVWNGGYKMLWGVNAPSGQVRKPGWHEGGIGDKTGCYQGEWVDGLWTGDQQGWSGYKWRGGWAYQAWDGQHWGNRMSFVHYNYSQMKKDMRGKTILSVTIKAVRRNSYHGYYKGHPLYLYNHKRDYTGSTSNGSTTTGGTTSGVKYYTVKSGDYLAKIAKAYNISVANLKSWNGLKSDLIHPGDRLKVSKGTTTGGTTTSADNRLNLYRGDNRALVGNGNQQVCYEWPVSHGNSFSFSNNILKQLVNNIANGDMKGIGMAKWYGSSFTTPAGYYNQDLAYMNFNKGSFALTVTYQ